MEPAATVISVYPHAIPPFVGQELERLYQCVFSSLPLVQVYADGRPVSTYVATRGGKPVAVLLYRVQDNTLRVLNEVIALDAGEIQRFADHVFAHMASVNVIAFNAIRTELQDLSLPFQKFTCSEDIVVRLPSSVDHYFASLGAATRKNIRRYRNKLARHFPQCRHVVHTGAAIGEPMIRDIIALNTARMLRKQKHPAYDERETTRMVQLAQACGMASLLMIDGRLAAGELCTQVGGHYYSHVGGHDPRYDDYGLGNLSCYLAICEAIRCGGKEFHFLWGRYPYKFAFLGQQRNLERLTIYRSRTQLCLNGRTVLQGVIGNRLRQLKSATQERLVQDRSAHAMQFAARIVNQWRAAGRG